MNALVIPAERLYWASLPAVAGNETAQSRLFRFERLLPVPVEQVQVIERRRSDGSWVLVGMAQEALRAGLVAEAARGSVPVLAHPDAIPAHIPAAGIEPEELNLLIGAFEPEPLRWARIRWHRLLMGCAAAIVMLLAAGAIRRGASLHRQAATMDAERSAALARAVQDLPGTALPETRLTMALRQWEQQAATAGETDGAEAWELMESVLSVWPSDIPVQIETLTTTTDRCVIRGQVPALADADRLMKALSQAPPTAAGRWQPEPVQVQQDGTKQVFVITLVAGP